MNIRELIEVICLFILFLIPLLLGNPLISIIVGLAFVTYYGFNQDANTLKFLTIVYVFQNIFLIYFSSQINPLETKLFLGLKEVLIYLSVFIGIIIYRKIKEVNNVDIFAILYLIILLANFVFSGANISAKVASLRQLLIPLICFYFGRILNIDKSQQDKYSRLLIYLGVFVAVFSLLELLILKDKFWISIGMQKYMSNKGLGEWASNGIIGSFYTNDLAKITGKAATRRVVSIFGDTMTSGHFMTFVILYIVYIKSIKESYNKLLVTILLIPTILCISKGIYLIMILDLIIYLYFVKKKKKLVCISSVFFVVGILVIIINSFGEATSTGYHLKGLISNFSNISLFGYGIGKSGNFAYLFSNNKDAVMAGESFIGAVVGQTGIIGIVAYVGFNLSILVQLYRKIKSNNSMNLIFAFTLVSSILLESLFSESAISILGTSLYLIFTGIIYEQHNTKVSGYFEENKR